MLPIAKRSQNLQRVLKQNHSHCLLYRFIPQKLKHALNLSVVLLHLTVLVIL